MVCQPEPQERISYFKKFMFWENYLWNNIHNHGMHSARQFIPLEDRGASRGDVVNSDTAAHWKSA